MGSETFKQSPGAFRPSATRSVLETLMKIYIVASAICAAGFSSASLLIDDFHDGPYTSTLTTPGSSATDVTNATCLGGDRATRWMVQSNPLGTPLFLSTGSGFQVVDSGTLADNWARTAYGFKMVGNTLTIDPMNFDLTPYSAFKINFISNDLNNNVKVYVGTQVGNTVNMSTLSQVAAGGNVNTPFSMIFNFANFTGSANFADADAISFEFDNSPSGDWAISSIEAVPEPASMVALGLGAAALIRRRRNKA